LLPISLLQNGLDKAVKNFSRKPNH